MEFVLAVVAMALVALVIALPVYLVRQLRSSSQGMDHVPDDLRRADDGRDGNGAGGPGLGPMWPNR